MKEKWINKRLEMKQWVFWMLPTMIALFFGLTVIFLAVGYSDSARIFNAFKDGMNMLVGVVATVLALYFGLQGAKQMDELLARQGVLIEFFSEIDTEAEVPSDLSNSLEKDNENKGNASNYQTPAEQGAETGGEGSSDDE